MPPPVKIEINKEEFLKVYSREKSIRRAAKIFGYKYQSISNWMKKNNIPLQKQNIYSCDEDFFSRDTEESFYWAGFIAADGNVCKKQYSQVLTIALSIKDIDHVYKFKNWIQSDSLIKTYKIFNKTYKCKDRCEIQIHCLKIYLDLKRFNIVPRKSLIYIMPEWIKNHPLVNHFLRGYIDGDGSFSFDTKAKSKILSICGTPAFLSEMHDIFYKNCDLKLKTRKITITRNIGTLSYRGNLIVPIITNFLYKNATIYLGRKFDIAYSTIESLITRYNNAHR